MRFHFADCELDTDQMSLTRAGAPVPVEPQVFDLLRLLVENAGRVVTRDEIVDGVWQGRIVSESAISARIASARKAVGDDGKRQAVIRTVARRGLQMVAEVSRTQTRPTDTDTVAPQVRFATNARGAALAYAVSGDGPPVINIDGAPLDIEGEWRVPALRDSHIALHRRFRLLRYNRAGVGLSSGPADGPGRHNDRADDIITVADAAGFDRFAVQTMSGGCIDGLHLAARYPDRVTRMVICGGYAEGRTRRPGAPAAEPLKAMLTEGWKDRDSGFAAGFLLTYFPEGPLDAVRDIARLMQQSSPPEAFLQDRETTNSASVADLLPRIACPVLLVHGRHDAVHPLSQAMALAGGIADSRLLVLETANHLPLPGHPAWETYLDAALRFLAGDR